MGGNTIEYRNLIKTSIERDVFVVEETQRTSAMWGGHDKWLFDFRAVMLKSQILNAYAELFFEKYKDKYPFQVCGLEVAALPLVTAIVMKFHEKGMVMNGFFIRKSRKKSGLLKMIEGAMNEHPVIIVDDLVNSGSSVIRQIEILKELEKGVAEIFSILRFRNLEYYTVFKKEGIAFSSLFELNDFKDSLKVANLENIKNETVIQNPFEDTPVWVFGAPEPNLFYVLPKSAPIVSEDKVYFGTDSGYFFALQVESGKEIWKYKVPFGTRGKLIFSTPAIYRDLVLFGAYDGNVYALDKNTGKRKWVFLEADWVGSSPCVVEDLKMVFVGLEYGLFTKLGGVSALQVETGEKVWEFRSKEFIHGSPAYSKKFHIVGCGSNDGVFYALDAKTGKLVWSFKTEGPIKYAPSFSDEHGVVVVLGHGETVYVLKTKTGEVVTQYKMDFGGYSTPLIIGNKAICSSLDKCVHCFDISTGKPLWKYNTGARCFATPVLINGKIYIGSNNARLFEINPDTGEVTGIFHTRERIMNKIAYDPKSAIFLIPTFANEIIALKAKQIQKEI